MAISTLDQWIASAKDYPRIVKTAARTTVALGYFSMFELAGSPGAGVLAGTSTAAGVVPTDAAAGCPNIAAFVGSVGYLSKVEFSNTVASRIRLYDMLFKAGAYAFNASTTLASQPSYSSRVPGGDYSNLEIWVEQVTAATGNQAVTVTYTNEAGVTGRTTGAVGIGAAPTLGRMWQLPLQSGDKGVQKIESVTGTVATVGTFNVLVLRPLWSGRVILANAGDLHGLDKTGMPQVFADSAIIPVINADSTSSGLPDIQMMIANA